MQKNKKIAPSTEKAKNLEELLQLDRDVSVCAELLHVDIMDGEFVERVLFSNKQLKQFVKLSKTPLDFHLMCNFHDIEKLDFYIALKPQIISVHLEAFKDFKQLEIVLKKIKNAGIKTGLAIKLETEAREVFQFLPLIDLVLIMSVKVGFGGQKFNISALNKIETLKNEIKKNKFNILLQVDGGIKSENAKSLFEKGADILVCGSYIFDARNRCEAIKALKQ